MMSYGIKNRNVVLGVCGGIAAYKSVELLRLITRGGAKVRVVMTANAEQFVGWMTFEALSGNPVTSSLFNRGDRASFKHIDWAQEADAVVIAPATANMLGKLAGGIADDALSTFMMVVTAPVLLCPSMNTNMYRSRAVQRNLETLKSDGYHVLEPGSGDLACGTVGPGRMPEPEAICDRLIACLSPKDLRGRKVLVTAGPTREAIDPVRFISNPSSGKMGFAVARAAEHRGAEVTLVSGPTLLGDPPNVNVLRVVTADEMQAAVLEHVDDAHIIVKTAAVSDYRPETTSVHKVKKEALETMRIEFVRTPDILRAVGDRKRRGQFLVGFAAETEQLQQHAQKKLVEKNLDVIVGNVVGGTDAGFNADTNRVTLFYRDGNREEIPLMEKDAVAHILLNRIVERLEVDPTNPMN
ncbi:MAG TPA: bifunctional phosphopantothenoylcysteine decarboxylase/phosphopantothenate--cysteine ligase CoaBC [Desulfobacterales bacterium]